MRPVLLILAGALVALALWGRLPPRPTPTPPVAPEAAASSRQSPFSGRAPAAGPATAAHATSRHSPAASTAEQALSLMEAWEAAADPHLQNAIQSQMNALLSDENAGEIFRALPSDFANTAFGLAVLERWAGKDRPAALAELARREEPPPAQIAAVLRGWVAEEDSAAERYAAALPAGDWKDHVLAALGSDATARQMPTVAIAFLRQMPPGERQATLLNSAAFKWAEGRPDEAAAWVNQIADPKLRASLTGSVARGYAISDPRAAAAWLLASLPPGRDLDRGLDLVVDAWVQEHTAAGAAEWIEGLPEGEPRERARRHLAEITGLP